MSAGEGDCVRLEWQSPVASQSPPAVQGSDSAQVSFLVSV